MFPKIIQRSGSDLTFDELRQIKVAIFREFKVPFNDDDMSKDRLFFLLKNGEDVLAMGVLWKVEPVIYEDTTHTVYGVLNVVANIKGQGYGKQVISCMKNYIIVHNLTGFGFCMPKNKGFYEKCGFTTNTTSTHRFIYTKDNKRITNQDGQIIFYQESSDKLFENILSSQDKEVSIPTANLW